MNVERLCMSNLALRKTEKSNLEKLPDNSTFSILIDNQIMYNDQFAFVYH